MSDLRDQLLTVLRGFDDEAYAALANRGLLRRAQKDRASIVAQLLEESAELLVMGFGEHRVRFDSRGPAHAQCSCPASGTCQHIIAVALQLPELIGSSTDAGAVDAAAELERLRQELLQISTEEMIAHAGKAGYRWAWQFLQDMSAEDSIRLGGTRNLTIEFVRPPIGFRYAGGGLTSIVAEAATAKVEKYRVAAVLAFQRAHGIVAIPPQEKVPTVQQLDLGKDHAVAAPGDHGLRDARARLRRGVLELLDECLELGLAHLSQGIQERFSTLAVWSQGVEYYRLAMLLRRIADHVEQLLERVGGADERRLLDECALAHGLVCALDAAAERGREMASLLGRARSRYEDARSLELLGLGAYPWRSAAGFVGLTMIFWSARTQEFLSCTDARPESQRQFKPVARYKSPGPWTGLGAPQMATGHAVSLTEPQVNALGRISGAETTTATVGPVLRGDELLARLRLERSWSELVQRRGDTRRSLLAEAAPMRAWHALQPARFGEATFDPVRQRAIWPVFDGNGQRIDLQLPYSEYNEHAIQRVEALGRSEIAPGTVVIARLFVDERGLSGEPLSIVSGDGAPSTNPVDVIYFDPAPTPAFADRLLDRFRRLVRDGDPGSSPTDALAHELPPALREIRSWIQRCAERGISPQAAPPVRQQLHAHLQKAETSGFSTFTRICAAEATMPTLLLRLQYACLQYERMLVDSFEAPA